MKKRFALCMLTLLSVILFIACGNTETNEKLVNDGDSAPMFDLKDLEDNNMTLVNLAGEKVYVKYWASWCSICLAGLDELDTLAAQDHNFKVISIVSPGFKGEMSTEKFIKWFERLDAKHITVLLDEDGVWAKEFGVIAYPTSYYIGSDGVLVKTVVGHNSNELITSTFKDIN